MFAMILKGILVSGSLIIAIGAQNAFVLKQGLLKQHPFIVATICFLCDLTLMTVGILGVGTFISSIPQLQIGLAALGALFLLYYGGNSLKSAFSTTPLNIDQTPSQNSRKKIIISTLAITLLNPHVYIDTVVLVGGIAGTLPAGSKPYFLIGTVIVSGVWFYGLAYGARLLLPFFQKPITWRILDGFIALVMFLIAFQLIRFIIALL